MLRKPNPDEECIWLVVITCQRGPAELVWYESEERANEEASRTLTEAAAEDWGPTDVWVTRVTKQGDLSHIYDKR